MFGTDYQTSLKYCYDIGFIKILERICYRVMLLRNINYMKIASLALSCEHSWQIFSEIGRVRSAQIFELIHYIQCNTYDITLPRIVHVRALTRPNTRTYGQTDTLHFITCFFFTLET